MGATSLGGSLAPDAALERPVLRRPALVHHWLVSRRGGERTLAALATLLPGAMLYTLVHDAARCPPPPGVSGVRTTALQRWPLLRRRFRALAVLHPRLYRGLQLAEHDLVLSSDAALAKTVAVPPGVPHVCYCYSPPRWAWDLRELYLAQSVAAPLRGLARRMLHRVRRDDLQASERVTLFIAASHHVRERIERCYGRQAPVAYPPVDTAWFTPDALAPEPPPTGPATDARPYLLLGEAVPYKRFDVAIEACRRLQRPLVVAGGGPLFARLARHAGPATRFVPEPDDVQVRALYRSCRALLFPGEEDFGLVPVEAMACGRPVVALQRGGATETVIDGVTGCLYAPGVGAHADVEALIGAIRRFETRVFDPKLARRQAEQFSTERFLERMAALLAPLGAGLTRAPRQPARGQKTFPSEGSAS